MIFKEAKVKDIPQMQIVRNAVKENTLSNPALVTDSDVEDYITRRGRGWVCEINELIVGFAIADLIDKNIWALFVHPDVEGKGVGKQLHDRMMNWYFSQTDETVWLSTSPGTRAEIFYKMQGWKEAGVYGKGELKFEMKKADWKTKDAVSDTTAAQ